MLKNLHFQEYQHLSVKKAVRCDIILQEVKCFMRSVIGWTLTIQMPTQFLQDESFVHETLNISCLCFFHAVLCNRKGILEFQHHLQILQML